MGGSSVLFGFCPIKAESKPTRNGLRNDSC